MLFWLQFSAQFFMGLALQLPGKGQHKLLETLNRVIKASSSQ